MHGQKKLSGNQTKLEEKKKIRVTNDLVRAKA